MRAPRSDAVISYSSTQTIGVNLTTPPFLPRHASMSRERDICMASGYAGKLQMVRARALDCDIVASISMSHDAGGGIIPQDALQPPGCFGRSIRHDYHAGMLGITDADAAAVMQ